MRQPVLLDLWTSGPPTNAAFTKLPPGTVAWLARAFQELVDGGGLLEHAEFAGNRYGTLKKTVLDALAKGENLLKDVDLQGARSIMAALPAGDLRSVFIAPPSLDELRRR